MTLIILLLDGSGLDEAAVEAVLLDAGAVLDATGAVLLATGAVLDAAGALLLAATLLDELTARLRADGFDVISGPRTTGDGYYESCIVAIEQNVIELTV